MNITSEELKTIELIVNKKGVTEEINKKINYNVALEQSKYTDFSYYIVMKCSDIILEQQNIILDYYDSINRECTVEKVKALIDVMYIMPLWNGYKAEEVKIKYLEKLGFKYIPFKTEKTKLEFDSELGIDFIVQDLISGKYYGIQSKCGSFLNMDYELRSELLARHIKALKKYPILEDIYYMFSDTTNIYEFLFYDVDNDKVTTKKGDCLISTHDVTKTYKGVNGDSCIAIRFRDFKYIDIREELGE